MTFSSLWRVKRVNAKDINERIHIMTDGGIKSITINVD